MPSGYLVLIYWFVHMRHIDVYLLLLLLLLLLSSSSSSSSLLLLLLLLSLLLLFYLYSASLLSLSSLSRSLTFLLRVFV